MAYIVPKVLINQEFTQLPVFADNPLSALVFGPQYNLHRYNVAAEKPFTALSHPDDVTLKNKYQRNLNVTYALPNQAPGTVSDAGYLKVTFENSQIEYYPNTELSVTGGNVGRVGHPIFSGSYYSNRFIADDLVFKTANGAFRSDDFSNRDVSPGDTVIIREVATDEYTTLRVKALHASKSPADISDATEDADNFATQVTGAGSLIYVNPGANAAITVPPGKATSTYVGHPDKGIMSDTYTMEVTTPGALNVGRFKVTSLNGAFAPRTNVALVTGDILNIDTLGDNNITVDFTSLARASGSILQLGDVWTLAVTATVNATEPVTSGTYTGSQDLVYKITVSRGGPFFTGTNADVCARVTITSDGEDSSGPVNVASAAAFPVGSYGVQAQFDDPTSIDGLILGDAYYVTAIAAAPAATNIIETYEKVPAALLASNDITDFEIVSMRYSTVLDVPAVDPSDADIVNWEFDSLAQSLTINQGITTKNASIVNGANEPIALDIVSADIFVTHRDLVLTNSVSIGSVTAADQVSRVLGTVHPDNPLAQGVYNAALNSNGAPVYFAGVPSDDLEGYESILALARKAEYYYSLVPLTFDAEVRSAVVGHVNALSTPALAKWRLAWLSVPLTESTLLYNLQPDTTAWKATITDDPFATGTQYRLVTMAGAKFITDGIRQGDKLRINFRATPTGSIIFDEYTVSDVRTEDTLVLAAGPASAINVAIKAQINRIYTKDEQINALSLVGGEYNNRRARVIFPPVAKNGTVEQPGYLVAAACAGLRSGVVPHQGLTNTTLLGFTDLSLTVTGFNDIQLNRLAEQGFWICTQLAVGSTPYIRHQLTTDTENLNTSEDSITTNVDSISYGLQRALDPFIGKYNLHPDAIIAVRRAIDNELRYRTTNTYTVRAGNQLLGYKILRIEQDATFKDRLVVDVQLNVPYPMNFITLTLFV